MNGCSTGKDIVELACTENKAFSKWKNTADAIVNEFETHYVLNTQEEIYVSSNAFLTMPKEHIFCHAQDQFNVLKVEITMKRMDRSFFGE
jgi:hypothetical protein